MDSSVYSQQFRRAGEGTDHATGTAAKKRYNSRHSTQTAAESREAHRILSPYLDDPSNFFVISSDFCHWGSRFRFQSHDPSHGAIHDHIHWLDHEGMALIQSQNVEGFGQHLAEHRNTICGRHPISVFLNALTGSEATFSVTWVKYAQSSKVTSSQDSSVSYASAVVTQESAPV